MPGAERARGGDATMLRMLQGAIQWGVIPGARIILVSDVHRAGGDVEDVNRFVLANGGTRVPRGDGEGPGPHWRLCGELFFNAGTKL